MSRILIVEDEATVRDTNSNGVPDGYEDVDGDGLADLMESLFGLNPLVANANWKSDTDGDGLPDAYETFIGLNPSVAEAAPNLPSYTSCPLP